MNQIDPLQSITLALQPIFAPFGVKHTLLGWPDTKFFGADGNLPAVAIISANDKGRNLASRETIHAAILNPDGLTYTVYREKLRVTYLLQISLFTYTPEDRSNIGWQIEQYLVTNPQLQIGIPGVETAVFHYRGQRDAPGETRFYQRDIQFEATARVLSTETAYVAKKINLTQL